MKILVLGVTGMLGNAMFRVLSESSIHEVYGTSRRALDSQHFADYSAKKIITGVEVQNPDSLERVFATVKPEVVINCIGLVKQIADIEDPLCAIPINSLLPHRLAALCQGTGARLVHMSSDCVFSGKKGGYQEIDLPDANDLYGRSKLLGEVNYSCALTLRTSIIGHELSGSRSLIGWFLSQQGSIKGYAKTIFSGLPTVELSYIVRDIVLPRSELRGIYHVAASPISKFHLLKMVAEIYRKTIEIIPDSEHRSDRSLNANRFRQATGYVAPSWRELITKMKEFR